MLDVHLIPDPGLPLADGYYKRLARARLQAGGIGTVEAFAARYGVNVWELTAFELLAVIDPIQGEHEVRLNDLYRAGLPKHRQARHLTRRRVP